MNIKVVLIYLSCHLITPSLASSTRKSQVMTVGLKRSQETKTLGQHRAKAAATKMLAETCSVSLKDFQDMYYYGSVYVGSLPAAIPVVFDTGSSDLWVASSYLCHKISTYCYHHQVYDHNQSRSYKKIGTPFSITYNKGYVSGIVSQDNVTVGGLTIAGQLFGEAMDMDRDTTLAQFSGVFGLAYPSLAMIDEHTTFVNMFHQGLLDQPVFAFSLNTKYDSMDGELTLGGLDPSHYTGDISYTPVIEQEYWKIQIDGISVGPRTVTSSCAAVPDSGSSLVGGPQEYIDIIHNAIGATDYGSGIYGVDCYKVANLPNISITIGGTPFVLRPPEYTLQVSDENGDIVCISGFMGSKDLQFFILGDVFMRRFYTVFDVGSNRVGFATNAVHNPPPTGTPVVTPSASHILVSSSILLLLTLYVHYVNIRKL